MSETRTSRDRRALVVALSCSLLLLSHGWSSAGYDLARLQRDPRLLGVPPREMVWAPAGPPRVAFLWNDNGQEARDLWSWAPGSTLRKLVDHRTLDVGAIDDPMVAERKETARVFDAGIGSFAWSPDGSRLLFEFNGDLFVLGGKGDDLRRLTRTASPEIDPKWGPAGGLVYFSRDNDLWQLDVDGGSVTQLTNDGSATTLNGRADYIALEELDFDSAYSVAPDGTSIAYVQYDISTVELLCIPEMLDARAHCRPQRRPPAGTANAQLRVGLVGRSGGPTRWAELPGLPGDRYVLALRWLARDRLLVALETRDNKSLALYTVDAATGRTHLIHTENDSAWINRQRSWIEPIDAEHFLFGSERTGFAHLYVIDVESGEQRALTQGDWEVVDLQGVIQGQVFFHAHKDSPHETQLYRVPLAGGDVARVTMQPGCHEAEVAPDGNTVVSLWSDFTSPPDLFAAAIAEPKRWERLTRSPAPDFRPEEMLAPKIVRITSKRDGARIPALYYAPLAPAPKGGRPGIVYVHGAGYTQDVRRTIGRHGPLHMLLARAGYAVISVDYRGSEGYGRDWRVAVHKDLGDLDLADAISAADWLSENAGVRRDRVGLWGISYGGFLALMAAGRTPGAFAAHIAGAPVADWADYDTAYTEERLGTPQSDPAAYARSSPITYASQVNAPLLLFHGLRDDNVHVLASLRYIDKLVQAGVPFEMMLYPDAKHSFQRDSTRIHLYRTLFDFFERRLRRPTEKP